MRGARPVLLLTAAAVLLLVVVAARGESSVPSRLDDAPLDYGLPGTTLESPNSPTTGMPILSDPELIGTVIVAVLAFLLVLAVTLSVIALLRGRNRLRVGVGDVVDPVEGTIDTVMRMRLEDAVAAARDTLARPGGEPGDAVIRAWVTLETATEHGRAPHQTATEFTISLLEKENADEEALRELRTLYQRARFGHRCDDNDAAAAKGALDRILATIR